MAVIVHVLSAVAALALAAASSPPASAAAPGWAWPVAGEVLTEYRNGSDPYAAGQHRGIDVAAAAGEPVVAARSGTVRFAGVAGSSGLTVTVRSSDGRFDASYLHLASIEVRAGEWIAGGERIGAVGTSGRRSTHAPHLHFGVREAGSRHAYLDPRALLPPRASRPERPRGAPAPVRSWRSVPGPAPVPGLEPAPRSSPVPRVGPAPLPRSLGEPGLAERPPAPRPRAGLVPGRVGVLVALLAAVAVIAGGRRSWTAARGRSGGQAPAWALPLLGRR